MYTIDYGLWTRAWEVGLSEVETASSILFNGLNRERLVSLPLQDYRRITVLYFGKLLLMISIGEIHKNIAKRSVTVAPQGEASATNSDLACPAVILCTPTA